ncbi:MAG: hypothetical protein ACRD2W_22745 [Acidimicrobiales bacterium]
MERVEVCGDDFTIVFFDASEHRLFIETGDGGFLDGDLLWAAGLLSENPEGAGGGWTAPAVRDAAVDADRAEHGPCAVAGAEEPTEAVPLSGT